ncbi:hypothetical protein [Methylocapsa sp. S129]|uniref:hypothetical protein n=1 Tax=Methylocapsa sp. S129 TaxID=1641869 RepID=UPI00131C511F|nr:hypothetical protein [Methylocapsa sp. S129]
MADYYPLLAKALANLPSRAAPTARRAIYERARKALIGQLRSIQPPMPEGDIASEDAALDQAIARLEAEYGGPSTPASAPIAPPPSPSPSPSAAASPKAPPAAPPSIPGARPNPPVARPAPAWTPKPLATPGAAPPAAPVAAPPASPAAALNPPPRAPVAPPAPRQPTLGPPSPAAAPSGRPAPPIEPARLLAGGGSSTSIAPPVAAHQGSSADDPGLAPIVAASPAATLGIPPARTGATIARPSAPGRDEAPRRSPWPLAALVVLICIAGAIAIFAYLMREKPQDLATKTTTEAADKTNPANQNKIAERIKGAGQSDPAPAAGETPIPTVTVPVAPVQVAPAPAGASASPHLADNAQTAAAPAPAAPAAAVPGNSRAAMLIGVTSDPQKPIVNLGSAIWSIIPASPGQPSSVAVRVEVDIPDQKMHATVTIRKNADASLPATHTIDLRATFADGAEIKGVKDMGLPQLRKDDAPTGDAVSGVRVKINDSYYLVGLTRSDADAAHNLDLLATRSWFDFPLLLNDDRIAKLTFTKGETGDKVMAQALDAWK